MNTKSTDIALLLLRVTFGGLMFFCHGISKAEKLFMGDPSKFADIMGIGAPASLSLAVFAEVLCAGLLILGLFTRWVTIPLIVTMLVAIFVVHISDPFAKMEKAILYLIPYLILLIKGGGWYSLDARLLNK